MMEREILDKRLSEHVKRPNIPNVTIFNTAPTFRESSAAILSVVEGSVNIEFQILELLTTLSAKNLENSAATSFCRRRNIPWITIGNFSGPTPSCVGMIGSKIHFRANQLVANPTIMPPIDRDHGLSHNRATTN